VHLAVLEQKDQFYFAVLYFFDGDTLASYHIASIEEAKHDDVASIQH
jgi:uncharacterized protein YhbP (UPF0306 family)